MKIYDFKNKRLYESNAVYTLSVEEFDADGNSIDQNSFEDTYSTLEDALEDSYELMANCAAEEGYDEDDVEYVQNEDNVVFTTPDGKKWIFTAFVNNNESKVVECGDIKESDMTNEEVNVINENYDKNKYLNFIRDSIKEKINKINKQNFYGNLDRVSRSSIYAGRNNKRNTYGKLAIYVDMSASSNTPGYLSLKAISSALRSSNLKNIDVDIYLFSDVVYDEIKHFNGVFKHIEADSFVGKIGYPDLNKVYKSINDNYDVNDNIIIITDYDTLEDEYHNNTSNVKGFNNIHYVIICDFDESDSLEDISKYLPTNATFDIFNVNIQNESVAERFSRLRKMFESEDDEDNGDDKSDDEEKSDKDSNDDENKDEEGSKDGDNKDDENSDDEEMKAVIITVKKGDEEKCKEEMINADIAEDDIEILDADEDAENVEIRIDVNSIMELKDYLSKKGIDLEEEIGGEIVDDSDDSDKEDSDEENSDDENKEGDDEDFDFDNLGDLFGAEEDEE